MRVRFHLPDFAGKFRLNLMFAEMLRGCPEYFREGVEIASFYGVFPPFDLERRKNSARRLRQELR
mgnify:CR=1 FL=1